MADLLITATAGLRTFQQALNVTGHNVANVNTEGYSRQRTEIVAATPQLMGGGYVGAGASTASITRVYQDYMSAQINDSFTYQNKYKTADVYSTQLNASLGDPDTGIFSTMQGVYESWNTVANDPATNSSSRFLLESGNALQQQVQTYRNTRSDLHNQVNGQLSATVTQVNQLTNELAKVNIDLGSAAMYSNLPPNDLLDHRDKLIKDINQYMDVRVFQNPNGTVDMYSSDGKVPLITDNRVIPLQITYNPVEKFDQTTGSVVKSDKMEIFIQQPGSGQNVIVTNNIKGGELGGAVSFRKDQFSRAEDELGLSVVGMSIAMNAQSRQGFDKAGVRGSDLFSLNTSLTNPKPYVNNATTNTGSQSLAVSGVANPNFVYNVSFNGASYDVTDAKTGALVAGGVTLPQTLNSVKIEVTGGTPNAGDTFMVNTNAPKLMSTASNYASINNTGTGTVATTGMPTTSFAYKLTYNGLPADTYDVTDAYSNAVITSGVASATLAGGVTYNGVTITNGGGTSQKGDTFVVHTNTDFYSDLEQTAYKDNRNSGTIDNSAITINLDKKGLSNNPTGSKFIGNDLSNPVDFAQVQLQLSKLQPRSYSLAFDGSTYSVTDSRTGQPITAVRSVDDPTGHPNVATLRFEGLQVDMDTSAGSIKPGDKFELRFLNDGVVDFKQSIANPDAVAYRGADTSVGNTRPLAIGNNVNAANMASMQDKRIFLNNTEAIQGTYSLMAGNVGSYHQSNKTSMTTQDALYSQLSQARDSVSGVNLDEEAANMMRFQQAYQAAAKIMQASQTMFDTIMGVVR
jgi:flagellar hook-associated protein 1 FlgK